MRIRLTSILSNRRVRRFTRHKPAMAGAICLAILILMALTAPLITTNSPHATDLSLIASAPGEGYILGGDLAGRDVWSRTVYGMRTSLLVGIGATALFVTIGTIVGLVAGMSGGLIDQILMRVADAFLSVPLLLLAIVFVAMLGPSLTSVIAVLAALAWPDAARIVRGQVLSLREADFVQASVVLGLSRVNILSRHILPNVLSVLAVVATLGAANAILVEAALSFLGLGIRPPNASLGLMINEARAPSTLRDVPWLWMPPAALIAAIVLTVNFLGDGLRDALDVKLDRGR